MNIIETANVQQRSYGEQVIARAPDHVRAAINRTRVKSGMAPVLSIRDYERLDQERRAAEVAAVEAERRSCGVWIERSGRLVPVTAPRKPARRPTTSRSTQSITKSRGPLVELVDRVLLVPTFGDAPAANVRGQLPETVARGAFGSAADLNKLGGWSLVDGHGGPTLAVAGDRLKAHESRDGTLVIEWIPDATIASHREVMAAIDRGRTGVSVSMRIGSTRFDRLPRLTRTIVDARLVHVAIVVDGDAPSYPGARCRCFRSARKNDAAELRRHLDAAIERARWHDRQARR